MTSNGLRQNIACNSKNRLRIENKEEQLAADAQLLNQNPLHASQFMEELGKQLPEGTLIFDEALTHSPELLRYLPQDTPGTYFQTRAGMLGTGLPGALGLKVARPDK